MNYFLALVLLVFVCLAQLWDVYTTSEILKRGGYEKNDLWLSIFAGLTPHQRYWTLLAAKLALVAALVWAFLDGQLEAPAAQWSLVGLAVLYGYVVVYRNTVAWKKL